MSVDSMRFFTLAKKIAGIISFNYYSLNEISLQMISKQCIVLVNKKEKEVFLWQVFAM